MNDPLTAPPEGSPEREPITAETAFVLSAEKHTTELADKLIESLPMWLHYIGQSTVPPREPDDTEKVALIYGFCTGIGVNLADTLCAKAGLTASPPPDKSPLFSKNLDD